jgi:REP element-mobilizing transposase RayT
MPRGPRLDFPGALHHLIVRGIERRRIFRSERDRDAFLDRLGNLVVDSHAGLYAWSLMPNHAHALLRTGDLLLSRLAQRWLGPYASTFNRVHRRCGHLFQNRFKNILVEEDPYLLELVRYIHLNPVRSRLPVTIENLDTYAWTGHAVLLGKRAFPAQDVDFVLSQFASKVGQARRGYARFVHEGLRNGASIDLDGGGLRRSSGGWELLPKLSRGRECWEYDERVLGSSEFVHEILARLDVAPVQPSVSSEATLANLGARAAAFFDVTADEIASSSKRCRALAARAVLCHVAISHHSISLSAVARHLSISRPSVARAVDRAPAVYSEHGCSPEDFLPRRRTIDSLAL